jgi:predicted Zn finger-like uncharacterized protein
MPMNGTTRCPHCNTRFKISEAQLHAHNGMVRCGQCLHIFDARPHFIPDQPDPQLEFPILNEPVPGEPADLGESQPAEASDADEAIAPEELSADEIPPTDEQVPEAGEATASPDTTSQTKPDWEQDAQVEEPEPDEAPIPEPAIAGPDATGSPPEPELAGKPETEMEPDTAPIPEDHTEEAPLADDEIAPMTLAEQVTVVHDEEIDASGAIAPAPRKWLWMAGSALLVLVLLAQSAYFFRSELAARLPALKPALVGVCELLGCTVPLPQNAGLMSIESSDLAADPARENRITLNALLRNHAVYAQAFPNLELMLNDLNDKPVARRVFRPADYLPPSENEATGLQPNHELIIKLYLDITDLRPTGYRLALFYPAGN